MCGRSFVGRRGGFGPWRHRGHYRHHEHHGHGGGREFMGFEAEKMSPGARVVAALSVLVPVALSGVFLVVFVPNLWWIFTTYFWIAFPAVGLLASGVNGLGEGRPVRVSEEAREREVLEAIQRRGEISAATAAAETSMTVDEADRRLRELAEGGHLEIRVRGGGIFYALWEAEEVSVEGLR
ncbi:MAG: hypothetical protein ACRDTR_02665 [Rubrobacter sp.]